MTHDSFCFLRAVIDVNMLLFLNEIHVIHHSLNTFLVCSHEEQSPRQLISVWLYLSSGIQILQSVDSLIIQWTEDKNLFFHQWLNHSHDKFESKLDYIVAINKIAILPKTESTCHMATYGENSYYIVSVNIIKTSPICSLLYPQNSNCHNYSQQPLFSPAPWVALYMFWHKHCTTIKRIVFCF